MKAFLLKYQIQILCVAGFLIGLSIGGSLLYLAYSISMVFTK